MDIATFLAGLFLGSALGGITLGILAGSRGSDDAEDAARWRALQAQAVPTSAEVHVGRVERELA